jgi:hypothetical protein
MQQRAAATRRLARLQLMILRPRHTFEISRSAEGARVIEARYVANRLDRCGTPLAIQWRIKRLRANNDSLANGRFA